MAHSKMNITCDLPVFEDGVHLEPLVIKATPMELYERTLDPFALYLKRHYKLNAHHPEHGYQSMKDIQEMVVDHITSATRLPNIKTWRDVFQAVRSWPAKLKNNELGVYRKELAHCEDMICYCVDLMKDWRSPLDVRIRSSSFNARDHSRQMKVDYYRIMREKGTQMPLRDFLLICVNTPFFDESLKDLIEGSIHWRNAFIEVKRHISGVHHNLRFFYPFGEWDHIHDEDKLYTSQWAAYLWKWYFGFKPDVVDNTVRQTMMRSVIRTAVGPTFDNVEEISKQVNETLPKVRDFVDSMTLQVNDVVPKLGTVLDNVGGLTSTMQPVLEDVARISHHMDESLPKIDSIIDDVKGSLPKIDGILDDVGNITSTLTSILDAPSKVFDFASRALSTTLGVTYSIIWSSIDFLKDPSRFRLIVALLITLFSSNSKVALLAGAFALGEILGINASLMEHVVKFFSGLVESPQQQRINVGEGGDGGEESAEFQTCSGVFEPVAIAGGIVTLLFIAFTGCIPTGTDTASIMAAAAKKGFDLQKLHNGARAIHALYDSIVALVSGTVEWLILRFCPSLATYSMIETKLAGYVEWAESVGLFTNGVYEVTMAKERKLLQAVVNAHAQGTKFLAMCIKSPELMRFIPLTTSLVRQLDGVKRAAVRCLATMDVKERNPILYLCGDPGVGKSKLLTVIAKDTVDFREKEFGETSENPIYSFNGALKHCDGYHAGTIVVQIDDFGQYLEKETMDVQFVMAAANETHYVMPKAVAEEKGELYDGKAVIISSNINFPVFKGQNTMSAPSALWRRFDVHAEAILDAAFRKPGSRKLDLDLFRAYLKANPNVSWEDCPHLKFQLRDGETQKKIGTLIDLQGLIKVWRDKQIEYHELHEMTTAQVKQASNAFANVTSRIPHVITWNTVFDVKGIYIPLTLQMLFANAKAASYHNNNQQLSIRDPPAHLGEIDATTIKIAFDMCYGATHTNSDEVSMECLKIWEALDLSCVEKVADSWVEQVKTTLKVIKDDCQKAINSFLSEHPTVARVIGCVFAAAGIFLVYKVAMWAIKEREDGSISVYPSSGEPDKRSQANFVYPSSGEQDRRARAAFVYPSSGEQGRRPQQNFVYPSSGEQGRRPQQNFVYPSSGEQSRKPQQDCVYPSAIEYHSPQPTGRMFTKPKFSVSKPQHAVKYENDVAVCSLRFKKHVVKKATRLADGKCKQLDEVSHVVNEVISLNARDDHVAGDVLMSAVKADWNAREFIQNRARRAMTPVYWYIEKDGNYWTVTGVGFRVQGRFMLVPRHLLDPLDQVYDERKFHVCVAGSWVEVGLNKIYTFAGKDLACVLLPPTIPAAPSILSHFLMECDLGKVMETPAILISLPPMSIIEEPSQVSYHDNLTARHIVNFDYAIDGTPKKVTRGWEFECCTSDLGKSGSMLLAFNDKMVRKILGFQVLISVANSKAYAECPTQEQMRTAMEKLDPTDVFPTSEAFQQTNAYSHPELVKTMIDADKTGNFDFTGLYQTPLGAIKRTYPTPSGGIGRKVVSAPAKSKIRRTPMCGQVYPIVKAPAILNRHDPRWLDKMHQQCEEEVSMETSRKWLHNLPEFDVSVTDIARDFFIKQMRFVQSTWTKKPKKYTVQETVSGVEGTHMRGMKMGTAAGVPYSHFYTMKGKNPMDDPDCPKDSQNQSWFYQDPDTMQWCMRENTVFQFMVEQYIEMAERGEQMEIIWQNSNKDETLPMKEKSYTGCKTCVNKFVSTLKEDKEWRSRIPELSKLIEQECLLAETHVIEKWTETHLKDTRIFTLPPMHYYSVFWMYFGSFMDFVMDAKFELFCACGMNKYGPDFTELYNRMAEFSPYTISMDHSKYDSRMKARLMDDVRLIVEEFYKGSSLEDQRVRRCIIDQMIHSYMLSGTTVFQKHAGNPSGSPMTTVMNSIVNFLYMATCFIYLARQSGHDNLVSLDGLMRSVRMVCYGDDIIVAIKEEIIPWFNFHKVVEFFGRFGMEVSHPSGCANSEVSDVDPIVDMQFLGNSFQRHPRYASIIVPLLQWNSILDQLNWFKGSIADVDQFYENIEDALYQIHFYGPEVFQEHKDRINDWLYANKFREVTFSYAAFNAFFLRAYGIDNTMLYSSSESEIAIVGNVRSGNHEFERVLNTYSNAWDISELIPDLSSKSLLIVGGGDGTVNSVINCLSEAEHSVPKLHLPLGTGCDIARAFGYTPNDTLENLELDGLEYDDVDIWDFNGMKFIAFCAIGRDAEVAFRMAERRGENSSRAQNIKWMATQSFKVGFERSVELTIDGVERKSFSFLWQNLQYYGVGSTPLTGLMDHSDGKLDFAELGRRDLASGILGTPAKNALKVSNSDIKVVAPTFVCLDGEAFALPPGDYKITHAGTTRFVVRGRPKLPFGSYIAGRLINGINRFL